MAIFGGDFGAVTAGRRWPAHGAWPGGWPGRPSLSGRAARCRTARTDDTIQELVFSATRLDADPPSTPLHPRFVLPSLPPISYTASAVLIGIMYSTHVICFNYARAKMNLC